MLARPERSQFHSRWAMRDMLVTTEPYPLTAWCANSSIHQDLDNGLKTGRKPGRSESHPRTTTGYLSQSVHVLGRRNRMLYDAERKERKRVNRFACRFRRGKTSAQHGRFQRLLGETIERRRANRLTHRANL